MEIDFLPEASQQARLGACLAYSIFPRLLALWHACEHHPKQACFCNMLTQKDIDSVKELKTIKECLAQILYYVNCLHWEQHNEDRRVMIRLLAERAKELVK